MTTSAQHTPQQDIETLHTMVDETTSVSDWLSTAGLAASTASELMDAVRHQTAGDPAKAIYNAKVKLGQAQEELALIERFYS